MVGLCLFTSQELKGKLVNYTSMSSKRVPRDIIRAKPGELVITSKGRLIPYEEMEPILERGDSVFIENISRQLAWSAAKRLTKKLGFTIKAFSAVQKVNESKAKFGYAFIKVEEKKEGKV